MSLIAVQDIRLRRGERRVLDGVALSIAAGELVGLLGPNGAGKTSLLLAALGLLPAEGETRLGDALFGRLSPAERARRVAFLPQEREIGWPLPVEALVALGRAPHRSAAAPMTSADHAAVRMAMEAMDVADLAQRPATELSGGERARVLIARALAQEAPLLLVDEPTAGLDPAHQIALMETLRRLARGGRGVLASLHDLGLAAMFCDRVVVLKDGLKRADGSPEAVLTETLLAEVYGVRARVERRDSRLFVTPFGLVDGARAPDLSGRRAVTDRSK